MKKRIFTATAMSAILAMAGCASKECYDNQNTLPLAAFYSTTTHKGISLSPVSVYGTGAPGDSLLADSAALEQIYLPFRPDTSATSYVFRYEGDNAPLPDTVTFTYRTQPWFTSEACGVVYYFHMEEITHTDHLIDSVAVPGMLITNANRRNIEIYLKEETDNE